MNLSDGRIGTIVKRKNVEAYGFIYGLTLNHQKEVLFLVKWADDNTVTPFHPANLIQISHGG